MNYPSRGLSTRSTPYIYAFIYYVKSGTLYRSYDGYSTNLGNYNFKKMVGNYWQLYGIDQSNQLFLQKSRTNNQKV